MERASSIPFTFFYPLDVVQRLEPDVRPARIHAVPVRAAERGAGPDAARRFLELLDHGAAARRSCASSRTAGRRARRCCPSPKPGISIALDIPVRDDTQALVDALNEQVIAEGGRIYLAKDSLHAARALPRDGAAAAALQRGAAASGTRSSASRARSRFASSETRHEARAILGGTKGMGRSLARALRGARRLGRAARAATRGARAQRGATSKARGVPGRARGAGACAISEKPETFAPALEAAEQALGRPRHGGGDRRRSSPRRRSSRPTRRSPRGC